MDGKYSLQLVTLSWVVAALASYTALDLAGRVRASADALAARCWFVGGAFSMGTGIWAMHFIGMLALELPIPIGYDVSLTGVSYLASICSSGIALAIVHTGRLHQQRLLLGGVAMGGGIATMHYVGMAAIKMDPAISYDPILFGWSIVIAVAASVAALWVACHINPQDDNTIHHHPIWLRIGAACLMAFAITGMHYIGMAAARFPQGSHAHTASTLSPSHLAGMVATVAIITLLVTLALSLFDNYTARKTRSLVTSLQAANKELEFLLLHDPLTRLPNRLLLEDRIGRVMARAKRKHLEFALLYIDLDQFKGVNDLLGHHIGDALIKAAATRIQTSLREMDTVARVGGDEFMILLGEGEPQSGIEQVARRIANALTTVFEIEDHEIRISGSIGISIYPRHGNTIQQLMTHADAAMNYAKEAGKNNYQVYDAGMNTALERRNKVASRLARAIDHNELTLVYQPRVDVVTGAVTGAEVLTRWTDRELGTIGPEEFIAIAEHSGQILRLGGNTLYQACQQAWQWSSEGLLTRKSVAVNVSAYQLNHKDFIGDVETILYETGLNHHQLELEVTESAIMQNPTRAGSILSELHDLGVKLSIDDFGTGYSNLVQLKRFPIDYLKIDRSFISGVTTDVQDAELVKAIVALANNLGMAVVAEGVETSEQLAFIRSLGIKHYQGFLFSKPLSAAAFKQLLTKDTLTYPPPIVVKIDES